jgi:hypothetical protein
MKSAVERDYQLCKAAMSTPSPAARSCVHRFSRIDLVKIRCVEAALPAPCRWPGAVVFLGRHHVHNHLQGTCMDAICCPPAIWMPYHTLSFLLCPILLLERERERERDSVCVRERCKNSTQTPILTLDTLPPTLQIQGMAQAGMGGMGGMGGLGGMGGAGSGRKGRLPPLGGK